MSRRPPDYPAIDPADYLTLAEELAQRPEAAAQRSAADRAYYAVFLFCRDHFASRGLITPYYSTEDHRYITEELRRRIGNLGNDERRLRDARNSVTYDTRDLHARAGNAKSIDWMIATARLIIERLKERYP